MADFGEHWRQRKGDRLAEREEVERNRIYAELWAGEGHRPDEVRAALRELERVFGVHPGRLRATDPLTLLFDPVDAGWNPIRRLAFRGLENTAADELSAACRERMCGFDTLDTWQDREMRTVGDWVAAWSGKLPGGRVPRHRPRPRRRAKREQI